MKGSAELSDCGRYRYTLDRAWDPGLPRLVFVMLNPSTADALQDDPTIRRCVGFAKAENFGALRVVNLFAMRATDPAELLNWWGARIGNDNDEHIRAAATNATVCCAWGRPKWRFVAERAAQVTGLLQCVYAGLCALGVNADGSPKHPLYLPRTAALRPWPEAHRGKA